MIPYGRQTISDDDIESVVEVLRSDWITQGPTVPLFEEVVADYCGAEFGVAVNSASSALHIACLAMGVGPDQVRQPGTDEGEGEMARRNAGPERVDARGG